MGFLKVVTTKGFGGLSATLTLEAGMRVPSLRLPSPCR